MKLYYAPNKNDKFLEVREVAFAFGHHAVISPSQDYLIAAVRNDEEKARRNLEKIHKSWRYHKHLS